MFITAQMPSTDCVSIDRLKVLCGMPIMLEGTMIEYYLASVREKHLKLPNRFSYDKEYVVNNVGMFLARLEGIQGNRLQYTFFHEISMKI